MPVNVTTRITSIWGTCFLLSLVIAGVLEGKIQKITIARLASWGAMLAFVLIAASGLAHSKELFYAGVVLLGLATGPATVSNLSLMLDMTVAGKVGMFIGAWGMANAVSRLVGSVLGGAVRDILMHVFSTPGLAYAVVFGIEAALLFVSLLLLRRIDVTAFLILLVGIFLLSRVPINHRRELEIQAAIEEKHGRHPANVG